MSLLWPSPCPRHGETAGNQRLSLPGLVQLIVAWMHACFLTTASA